MLMMMATLMMVAIASIMTVVMALMKMMVTR